MGTSKAKIGNGQPALGATAKRILRSLAVEDAVTPATWRGDDYTSNLAAIGLIEIASDTASDTIRITAAGRRALAAAQ